MTVVVQTEAQLNEALNAGANTIVIEGDLAKRTFRVQASGAVSWAIAIGATSVALLTAMLGFGIGGEGVADLGVATMARFSVAPEPVEPGWHDYVPYLAGGVAVIAVAVGWFSRVRGYRRAAWQQGRLVLKRR